MFSTGNTMILGFKEYIETIEYPPGFRRDFIEKVRGDPVLPDAVIFEQVHFFLMLRPALNVYFTEMEKIWRNFFKVRRDRYRVEAYRLFDAMMEKEMLARRAIEDRNDPTQQQKNPDG
jgi:hypothetical protein